MDSPIHYLKKFFGYDKFRSQQESIVRSILLRNDTLVVMPTGGGKSICYQLPALMLPDLTIVISPLIALMKDQVETLRKKGIPASFLNSSQTQKEQSTVFSQLKKNELKLLYVAPERFRAPGFSALLKEINVSLFAIDEAHCLSQWGHDFRPDYLHLDDAIAKFKTRPIIAAFTATATPIVRDDILRHLHLKKPEIFITGFRRNNLCFEIIPVSKNSSFASSLFENKLHIILDTIEKQKVGIIYCATRKSAEKIASALTDEKISLIVYHGGMSEADRNAAQDLFIQKKVNIAIATNAFGMGIDRSDIRFVIHYEMPGSIEAYYQEAGRAGRDGKISVCKMLFNFSDKRVQEFFIDGANPDKQTIIATYQTLNNLADNNYEVKIANTELAKEVNHFAKKSFNAISVSTALLILARYKIIERFDIPGLRIRGSRILQSDLTSNEIKIRWEDLDRKRENDFQKLNTLIELINHRQCRQKSILEYFGDIEDTEDCGICDICQKKNYLQKYDPGVNDTDTEEDDGSLLLNNNEYRQRRTPDAEELILIKKILSGIARMSNKIGSDQWAPKFGKLRILECLTGSKAAKIVQFNLDKLSTYGILEGENKTYLLKLFTELENEGLIQTVTTSDFPLCKLTPFGSKVMRGVENFAMTWPSTKIEKSIRPKTSKKPTTQSQKRLSTEEKEFLKRIGAPKKKTKKTSNSKFRKKSLSIGNIFLRETPFKKLKDTVSRPKNTPPNR